MFVVIIPVAAVVVDRLIWIKHFHFLITILFLHG